MLCVAFVQTVNLASLLDLHVPVNQYKFTDCLMSRNRTIETCVSKQTLCCSVQRITDWVKHEAVDSVAGGEYDHGGAAIKSVAGCDQISAWMQGVLLTWFIVCGLAETIHY